jgi:phospholipid/cholesterol/gamma-HCH transport system substrate-binding protein
MSHSIKRNRRRPRKDTESAGRTLAKGLAVTTGVLALVYIGLTSYNGVPGRSYGTLYTDVSGVGNLIDHDPVRIAGVRVGQVQKIGLSATGRPRITMQIEPHADVPTGSIVRVRANGLLGARYVQIIPGSGRVNVPNGATIPAPGDALSAGVSDALDTFDASTRGRLGDTVDGLGEGLLGQGAHVNDAMRVLAPAVPRFSAVMRHITSRPGSAERLLPALDRLITPLDAARDGYASLLRPAGRAIAPFADQRTPLRQALADAPPALVSAQNGLARGRLLLGSARHLSGAVRTTLPTVAPGLRAATGLLRTAPPKLTEAGTLLSAVRPAVPDTLKVVRALKPLLPRLSSGLSDAIPMLDYVAPRACDVENFGVTMRSMTGFGGTGDGPIGPLEQFRAQAIIASETLAPLGTVIKPVHEAYAAPCKYLSEPYAFTPTTGGSR